MPDKGTYLRLCRGKRIPRAGVGEGRTYAESLGMRRRWHRNGQLADELGFQDGMPAGSPPYAKMTGVNYPD